MKANLHLLLILLTPACLNAQTNDRLKRESDRNSQQRESSRSGSRNSGRSNDSDVGSALAADVAGGCIEGCVNGGCLIFFDALGGIFKGLSQANTNILARESEVSRINSVDLGCNLGYENPNSTLLMPSVKLRGGLLSTSLRVFSNTEKHSTGKNNYTTINWQILQFNLAVEKDINVNLGTGILYETYGRKIFNEFGLGFEIYPRRLYIPIEMRFTPDYATGETMLFEINTGIGYNIQEWKNTKMRLQLNYTYGRYYEAVDVNGLSVGLVFLFDTGTSRIIPEEAP